MGKYNQEFVAKRIWLYRFSDIWRNWSKNWI